MFNFNVEREAVKLSKIAFWFSILSSGFIIVFTLVGWLSGNLPPDFLVLGTAFVALSLLKQATAIAKLLLKYCDRQRDRCERQARMDQ